MVAIRVRKRSGRRFLVAIVLLIWLILVLLFGAIGRYLKSDLQSPAPKIDYATTNRYSDSNWNSNTDTDTNAYCNSNSYNDADSDTAASPDTETSPNPAPAPAVALEVYQQGFHIYRRPAR